MRKKTQNVRELIRLLGYGVGCWIIVSFVGTMTATFSFVPGDPKIWVDSLLYSLVLSLFMIPALFVMHSLPKVENVEEDSETIFPDSDGLGVPEEVKPGEIPEDHGGLEKVWNS